MTIKEVAICLLNKIICYMSTFEVPAEWKSVDPDQLVFEEANYY